MSIHSVRREDFSMQRYLRQHKHAMEEHMQAKHINRFWIAKVLCHTGTKVANYFPYKPKTDAGATIARERITPDSLPTSTPSGSKNKPVFLINIPLGRLPLEKGYDKFTALAGKLKDESYSDCPKNSKALVQKKLAVVFGINQLESIDRRVNDNFRRYVKNMPQIAGLSYRVTGFFWTPVWEVNDNWKNISGVKAVLKAKSKLEKKLYSREQAFFILSCIDRDKSKAVRLVLEGRATTGLTPSIRSQIPFQKIRQAIKSSPFTTEFARAFSQIKGVDLGFYVTMDGDCEALRSNGKGYFTHMEEQIAKTKRDEGHFPSVITLGYQLPGNALPIPKLAVRCDMAVRAAMNWHISGSAYPPEPGTAYCLYNNDLEGDFDDNLKSFSFLATGGKDARALESRRAIDNGTKAGILNSDRIIFSKVGALTTAMPGRMKTQTCEAYEVLSPADIKKQAVLRALRGVSQVHFSPLEWGHNVYQALPDDYKKGAGVFRKLSGVLSKVFAVFDPIGLVNVYNSNHSRSFSKSFDRVFDFYESYLKAIHEGEREGNVKVVKGKTKLIIDEELENDVDFIQGQFSLLLTVKQTLMDEGFSKEWAEKVIDAASASGKALYRQLKAELD